MAIPKGNYTAYQQTTADSKLEFGQMAKDVAASELANQKRAEEREQKRRDEQSKISESFRKDYATLTDVITGTESIDEAFALGIMEARDKMGEIYKRIKTNPRLADDPDIIMQIQGLNSYSQSLKTSSDVVTDFNTRLAQGMQDGTLSNWNNKYLNIGDSIFNGKNLTIGVDSKGRPIGATVQVDDNGEVILGPDGLPIVEDLRLPQKLAGGGLPELVPNYNMAADAQKIGKDLADRTRKSVTGAFSTQEAQTWDMMVEDARGLIKGYLGDAKNPSSEAKSIWTDVLGNKPKELDEDDMKEIEDAYLNSIKPFYDQTLKNDTDFSARNAAAERARKERESAKEDKVASEFTVVTDQDENIKKEEFKGMLGFVPSEATPFALPLNPKTKESSITVTGKDGHKVASEFTVVTDQDENIKKEEFKGMLGFVPSEATPFALPLNPKTKESSITVTGKDGHKVVVDRVYLSDEGQLAYSGYELRGKATGSPIDPDGEELGNLSSDVYKKKIGGGMVDGSNVLTSVAKAYDLNNEGQLKKLLSKRKESFLNSKKPAELTPEQKARASELINKYSNRE